MFSPSSSKAVASIPQPPAHGVNAWCLSAARRCALAGYTQVETFDAIVGAAAGRLRADRELSRFEVERAISTVYATPHQSAASPRVTPLPSAEIARHAPPMSEAEAQAFMATSPLSQELPSAEILSALFN